MIHITSHIFLLFFIILIHAFDVKYFFHAGQMIFYTKHAPLRHVMIFSKELPRSLICRSK